MNITNTAGFKISIKCINIIDFKLFQYVLATSKWS